MQEFRDLKDALCLEAHTLGFFLETKYLNPGLLTVEIGTASLAM